MGKIYIICEAISVVLYVSGLFPLLLKDTLSIEDYIDYICLPEPLKSEVPPPKV